MPEIQNETKHEVPPLNGTSPLAQKESTPLAGMEEIVWTRERIDLIKRQICPAGASDDEFRIFIEQAKRAQLDPLMNECFMVPRGSFAKVKLPSGRMDEIWVERHVFQAGEQGMNARADRFEDFGGMKGAVFYEKDKIEVDAENGVVHHLYNPAGDRGAIKGAWAVCARKGRVLPIEIVYLSEYLQTKKDGSATAMWKKPATMLMKCARAAAWRRAYPNVFGHIIIKEELPDEDEERELNREVATAATASRTDQVAQKVAQKAAFGRPPEDAQVVNAPKEKRIPGQYKKQPIAALDATALTAAIGELEKSIAASPLAPWTTEARAVLDELQGEQQARVAQVTAPREPGSDDAPF